MNENNYAAVSKKESLISQAEALVYSTDYKNAKDTFKRLQDEWKRAPRASKAEENRLWERFRAAGDRIYANAQQDYEQRQARQQDARRRKERLVSQAEALASSTDYKAAKDSLKRLQEEWKSIPRASKQDEENLWAHFRAAGDRVYDNAKRDYEQRQARQREAKNKKESLISQAESLAYSTDFKATKESFKRLQEEWKNTPRASKQDEDNLWARFRAAGDRVYAAAKQNAEQKHREFIQRTYEKINRKRDRLNNLERAILNKESQLSEVMSRPEPKYNNPNRFEIARKRSERISQLNSQILDMKMQKSTLVNEILELESKANS